MAVQADPEPQRNRFVRSDQYSFIKLGIPALAMKVGYDDEFARGRDRRQVDRGALSRAVGRSEPADRPVRGRHLRGASCAISPCASPTATDTAEMEQRQLLQALRAGREHPLLTRRHGFFVAIGRSSRLPHSSQLPR